MNVDALLEEITESGYLGTDYKGSEEDFVLTLINDAVDEIVDRMYPFGISDDEQELAREQALKRYKSKVKRIVQYHYDKNGKSGVVNFTESGVQMTYENAGTPNSFFRGIIPRTRIV